MADPVHVEGNIDIARPVDEVFDFVADQRNEPLYNAQMTSSEKVTGGPIGVGTQFHATITNRGKPTDMVIEVTGFERPRHMESTSHLSTMDLDGGLTFEPVPGGTRMSWAWNVRPTGFLAWLRPLVGAIGSRNERRIWTGLKRHLERAPVR
jgi:hypothetical protein